MPSFSSSSKYHLSTCDHRLQNLFNEVIKHYDCTVIVGHRTQDRQQEMYESGRSKVQWPNSKHNSSPSLAADVAPYMTDQGRIPWPKRPNDWKDQSRTNLYLKDLAQFYHFAGFVQSLAIQQGTVIRWGGDWDRDHVFSDQSFDDLVHFELL